MPKRKDWLVIENFSSPNKKCYYLYSKELHFTDGSVYWEGRDEIVEVFDYKVLELDDYNAKLQLAKEKFDIDYQKCQSGSPIF